MSRRKRDVAKSEENGIKPTSTEFNVKQTHSTCQFSNGKFSLTKTDINVKTLM